LSRRASTPAARSSSAITTGPCFAQNHHQHNDAPRDDRYGDHKQGSHALRLRPSRRAEYSECLALPRAPSGRTVGENDLPSARPIRNGLLIALKAVAPHAAPARSVTSASAASASAASASAASASAASAPAASAAAAAAARPRPDAPPGPPRFTSTFACSPYDPHHQPDHSRDDRDDNNTHQDARHNTPPSQQVPPLSALLPGSFRAPTPIGTSSWVLFLVGYRSRRVLVSCSTPPQFAGQSVVPFLLLLVLGELVQTTAGKWITHPPTHCPNGRNLGVNQVLAGHQACLGHGGGHTTCRCHRCETTVYGPPLNPLRDIRRACDCEDLERAGLTPKTPVCHR